jgi:hypothetical protein
MELLAIFVVVNMWENKGGGTFTGVMLGLLLGWIGVLIAAIATPSGGTPKALASKAAESSRECPHCKSMIRRDASVCPHCQRESAPWRLHNGRWWVKGSDGKDYYLKGREWVEWTG